MNIKSLLYSSLFILSSSFAFGQQQEGFTNKREAKNQVINGQKEGKWLDYLDANHWVTDDTTAPVYCLTLYKAGKEYGVKRYYSSEGILMSENTYTEGKLNGLSKEYYSSGQVKSEYAMKDGISDGLATEYYENGKLKAEVIYKAGKVIGVSKEYHDDGTLASEYPYKDGRLNGLAKTYYKNGKIMGELNYKDDSLEGSDKDYFENGKLQSECTLIKGGIPDGIEKEYYENGNLESETLFKKGNIQGEQKINYENGKINWIMPYKDSKPDGIAQEFDEKGKLKEEYPLEKGKEKPLDFTRKKDAKNISVIGQKQGRWLDYLDASHAVTADTNAPVYCLTIYICGYEYGIKRYYSHKGILMSADPYLQGKLNGIGKEYYEDGKVKAENTYYDGDFIKSKKYDRNGKEVK
ncbi:MAG TPA: toxin-antitoxin system YwqK family antitoxin [Bacteroidia bacterium]|jgi:antitoxin component YwqK of YwqJK toxin-antitoxin module|nr:toxin-antitoxin system YwqK family antitoxin [Bacteroidia bacterium]